MLDCCVHDKAPPHGRASSEEDLVKRCSSTALVTSFPPVTTWKHSYKNGRGGHGKGGEERVRGGRDERGKGVGHDGRVKCGVRGIYMEESTEEWEYIP